VEFFWEAVKEAYHLLRDLDPQVLKIISLSLRVSLGAVLVASVFCLPLATWIALRSFPARGCIIVIINTCMAIPSVAVGLILYGLLCRQGLFGPLDLLYTPLAIFLGQTLLIMPLMTGILISSFKEADPRILWTATTLGASRVRGILTLWRERRLSILSALAACFGRAISEVGCAMIVGGNIKDHTRIITTTIAQETRKGEFAIALALGIVLILIALTINILLQWIQQRWIAAGGWNE
jgi:tungstate transport system permease protein